VALARADRNHLDWQQCTVGEIVPLRPTFGLPLAYFEPGRALVPNGWGPFAIEPIDDRRTRLISRSGIPKGRSALVYALLLEISHVVMQRKMLLGIKERAERIRLDRAATDPCPPNAGPLRTETPAPSTSERSVAGSAVDTGDTAGRRTCGAAHHPGST